MTRIDAGLGGPACSPQRRNARRLGFSLAEVIVAMLIVAVLASFVIPTVFSRGKEARGDAIVAELTNLESGIMLYRNDVGRYPGRLDYLNKYPAGTLVDACNVTLSAANQAKFRGPYISRSIVLLSPGLLWYVLATGDSVDATLSATVFGGQRVINISVIGPELDIANDVDTKIDGVAGAAAGKLQYTDNSGPGVNTNMEKILTYSIPIKPGAC